MAAIVLKNAQLIVDGVDLSANINAVVVDLSSEIIDQTPISMDSRKKIIGMRDNSVEFEGFYEAGSGNIDEKLESITDRVLVSVAARAGVGEVAYVFQTLKTQYAISGQVGQLVNISFSGSGNAEAGRGAVVSSGSLSTGNSSVINLGAAAAATSTNPSGKIWIAAQISNPGTTVDIELYESATEDFSSSTSVGSITQIDSSGGFFVKFEGPITGPYYRATLTVSGSATGVIILAKGV